MRIRAHKTAHLASTLEPRLNSLTHGAASRQTFLPNENPKDFFNLLYDTHCYYKPSCALHAEFVTNLAEAQWHLKRCRGAFQTFEEFLYEFQPDSVKWTEEDHHRLHLFARYQTQAERTLQRALSNVRAVTKDAERSRKWEQLYENEKQKFDLQLRKFEAAQAREKRAAAARETRQNNTVNKEVIEIRSVKNAVSSPQDSPQKPVPAEPAASVPTQTHPPESNTASKASWEEATSERAA